ncbi:MAG: T9SS type A sorting domain-containing protein [Bacteroidales bacterium]|nr:T9SS type A sorting domain-containing protein [Bacteroidales bacterium]MDT8430228.1 T9SS type A sorting domain-containing protein [Bacteroidales bacterium]
MEKRITLLILVFFIVTSVHATQSGFPGKKPLSIYPNPATDQLKVEFTTENAMVPEIRIYDLTGKMVRRFDEEITLDSKVFKADLDISDLKSGIYFVKVIQGERVWSEKLLVQ